MGRISSAMLSCGDLLPLTSGLLYNYVDIVSGRLRWKDTEEAVHGL
jgi:hypothetical protein